MRVQALRRRLRQLTLCGAAALLLIACDSGSGAHAPAFRNTVIAQTAAEGFGRDFSLTDHNGQPRHLADYKGKVVVLFFGYTQCPDICPTTLANMAEAMRVLGAESARVQVLFITLDPERDTRQLLATYVPAFHPSFIGLFGDVAATAAAAHEFKVFYQKQPGSTPNNYSIDHTANSYIYDPQGHLRLYVKHGETPDHIAADIRLLLAGK